MQDTTLFETILGITTPWHVARVELKTGDKRVDLWLEHDPTRWPCPECGELMAGFDHAEARTWRHLDTCQFETHLHAEIPRVQCPMHGVKQVRVPWAEPRSRFTLLMERLIVDLILQCSTVKGACQIAGVSWDEAWGIMSRAVARGQARKEARPIPYVGVDEKAFRKGHTSALPRTRSSSGSGARLRFDPRRLWIDASPHRSMIPAPRCVRGERLSTSVMLTASLSSDRRQALRVSERPNAATTERLKTGHCR